MWRAELALAALRRRSELALAALRGSEEAQCQAALIPRAGLAALSRELAVRKLQPEHTGPR
ncbi:hypothetical protein PF008_g32254 [Phytophthora fragariae]|uniref:Uncharacterized protein n=1 Tax=Phytophthora fragariae TaxID=53985 RepID=A0A6G0Q114_9STRA|nr:hypothetical protein PF008_g32254 [Phytophthora fragariae]